MGDFFQLGLEHFLSLAGQIFWFSSLISEASMYNSPWCTEYQGQRFDGKGARKEVS